MKPILNPSQPPGRANRKARAYANEIARLVAEGYGSEAIREALAQAGVVVSTSTVKREIVLARKRPTPPYPAYARTTSAPPPMARIPSSGGDESMPTNGKALAETFVRDYAQNPLIRKRTTP